MADNDYTNIIQGDFGNLARQQAVSYSGASADDAARSLELEKATGIPSTVINSDLPTFEAQHKAQLTGDIVGNNEYLGDFVRSHPLAASVANDDYGTLDEISNNLTSLQKIHNYLMPFNRWDSMVKKDPLKHFKGELGSWMPEEDKKAYPAMATALKWLGAPVELVFRGITGTFGTAIELISDTATSVGGEQFGREVAGLAEAEFMGLTGRGHMHLPEFRAKNNEIALKSLDEAVSSAQGSALKERSPDMFQKFVEQHVENNQMELSGRKAAELYGEKQPMPDDGLLGWIPNIDEQLAVAKETGANISVPMADWIAKVDPAVHRELKDDLRVVRDGLSRNEAAEQSAIPPIPTIDETLPKMREAFAAEPLFSIGDRKLQIQRMAPVKDDFTSAIDRAAHNAGMNASYTSGFHDFDLVNEHGQKVGWINASIQDGGKGLYIDMVGGNGEYYNPNNFGPALMRDIARQLKAEFPETEYITGHRVSGARFKDGESRGIEIPKVRFAEFERDPQQAARFSELMHGAWADIDSYGIRGYAKNPDFWRGHETELVDRLHDEMARIAPKARFIPFSAIEYGKGHGIHGVFFPKYRFLDSLIGISLNSPDQVGTLRHEIIHHLYRDGFFSKNEWAALEKAAVDEGWIDRFQIKERYPHGDAALHLEEAIAEGYRQWQGEYDVRKRQEGFKDSPIDKIFLKLKDLFDSIKKVFADVLGREPTFEDIFQKIDQGEIGRRESGEGLDRAGPAFQTDGPIDAGPGTDVVPPFRKAQDVGMTIDQYKRYIKLIEERQQADIKASTTRIQKQQEKRLSKEWKDRSEAMRPDVVKDLNSRPDVAADKFLGLGELYGEKLDKTYRLDWEKLTPEQREVLPESYTVRKGGVDPDQIASLFGYKTGDEMINAVAGFDQMRRASGKNRDAFQRQLIQLEINKRMEMEHGFLEKNILEETMDQVMSENQLNLLHEETTALAMMAGEKGFDLTRDQLATQIKAKFDRLQVGFVQSQKFMDAAGKNGKAAEMALLQQKPKDAFIAKQAQYYNMLYADLARRLEKEVGKLEKAAKPFSKRDIKNIEPEYLNHIQDLLGQGGFKIGRSAENIQENLLRRGGKTLEQFADEKLAESFGYRDIPVADAIIDKKVKDIHQMSTQDFLGYKQTIDALIKNARDEQKIYREGETADRKAVLDEMKDLIKDKFEVRSDIEATPSRWSKVKELPRTFIAGLTNMETFLNRLGSRDPNSVFNKYVVYPAAAAANRKSALQREFARYYKDIGEVKDATKLVDAPLIDPLTGEKMRNFTRANVAQMIANAGNKSNWDVLAKGYKADPAQLMDWLVKNSTREDWERAQKQGKDIFGRLIKLADQEYERINGVTVDKIPLESFTNAHGTFEGWYHPLIADPIRKGKQPLRGDAWDDSDFGHITTSNGYTKKRSGAAYPLDLNSNMTPIRINQMIHDISFRDFVLQTQKLFKDSDLSNTITSRYGAEYNGSNFLIPWLRGISGSESIPSKAMATASRVSEYLRQNVISTYIGFNPFTAFKHGPTALFLSTNEVGAKPFLQAVRDLYSKSPEEGLANHEFAMKWSEELQRRERHWQDTMFGAHKEITGATTLRDSVIEKGSWLVAQSDMMSAKPTWLAAYRNAQEEGLSHGDSIDRADAAVRRAHGSTAVTNQPSLVRGGGPVHGWLTSVYGFFGTAMQRRIELAHDLNDTYKLVKEGEISKAAGNIPGLTADMFAYIIWPTIVEEYVTGMTTDDKRGWGHHVIAGAFLGLSSSVLYLRDIIRGVEGGQDIGVGLISSPLHDTVKMVNDLKRKDAFSKARAGKTIGDTLSVLGHGTGMAPKTIDNAIRFGIDLVNNVAHPRSAGDWFRGVTKGTTKAREVK